MLCCKEAEVLMKVATKRNEPVKLPKHGIGNRSERIGSRKKQTPTEGALEIQSILVPVDFSAPSLKALEYAAAFAARFGAKVTILHVVEPMGLPDFAATSSLVIENDKLVRIAEEKLRSLPVRCKIASKIIQKGLVRTGKAFHEIVEAARTLKVDLIVIATNGNTGIKHLLLGSTAERVVRRAPCPVFIVRQEEREILQAI
jgi:universal stress protein A